MVNNWAQMTSYARAIASMSLRRDTPGGVVVMNVAIGDIPFTIKVRPHVCEMVVCGLVVAEKKLVQGL